MFPRIEKGKPAVVLAPMEGVTDFRMRAYLTAFGGYHFCITEFLRITDSILPPKVYRKHFPEIVSASRTANGTPVQLQLLGGDADKMARSARRAFELGAKAIDINFGCPAPTVNRHDGGAALLKYPHRIREIVAAVRSALPLSIPVSAKLRLGYESIADIDRNAQAAEEGGADWITIHARTRMQSYRPPVYWEGIGRVRKALGIPVVANGDLHSVDDFKRCREVTGAEHFMLGRGALASPGLAKHILAEMVGEVLSVPNEGFFQANHRQWGIGLKSFWEHCQKEAYFSERQTLARMKQWLNLASRAHPIPWFDFVKRSETPIQLIENIDKIKLDGNCV